LAASWRKLTKQWNHALGIDAAVIIPPQVTAVPSESTTTQRDRHIAAIEAHGRMGWQRRSGYNRRSLAESAMYRY
jgi:hypothetical protein